jgi:hypothetical protein
VADVAAAAATVAAATVAAAAVAVNDAAAVGAVALIYLRSTQNFNSTKKSRNLCPDYLGRHGNYLQK